MLFHLFSGHQKINLTNQTDWHSHILPGVDDGVPDLNTSLAILKEYETAGISHVWLTPHIMEDIPNTISVLKRQYEELISIYCGNIVLRLASENMIDSLFMERLKTNDFLPIGDRHDMLLVETSIFNAPMDFEDTLVEIKSKGYYPLLAHPERYNYIHSIKDYKRLKDIGVRFQLNLFSLEGAYGKSVKKKAHDMLKLGMYDFFGSDLHRYEQIHRLTNMTLSSSAWKSLRKIMNV